MFSALLLTLVELILVSVPSRDPSCRPCSSLQPTRFIKTQRAAKSAHKQISLELLTQSPHQRGRIKSVVELKFFILSSLSRDVYVLIYHEVHEALIVLPMF